MATKTFLDRLRQSASAAVSGAEGKGKQRAWRDGWLSDWIHGGKPAADGQTQPDTPEVSPQGETGGALTVPVEAKPPVAGHAPATAPATAKPASRLSARAPDPGDAAVSRSAPAGGRVPGNAGEGSPGSVNVNTSPSGRAGLTSQTSTQPSSQTLRPVKGRPVNGRPVNLEAAFAPQLEKDLSKEKRMPGDPNAPVGATPPDTSALNKQIVQAVNFTNYQNLANAPAMVITPPEMSVGQTTAIAVQDAESYMNAIMQIAVAGQAVAIKKAAQGPAGELIAVPLMAEIQAMVQAAVAVYGSVSTTAGTSASTVIGDLKTAVS
ncbi:Uncharacterised protein [Pannonibacter phragmitetus]|uniref:Uncharacterized protein n=1 Tax=Pannonibacter phragmitetus TaxID=121719 RepID=A0A378ZXI3_9HYPH|nr:hypothetical protein [Pannonibacter phragmitetus]SUB01788.1 Uncharacterised protein [Pannonibacter phragmitetus]